MKKFISIILAAVMLLGCMSITAFAETVSEGGFTFDTETGIITKYEGTGGDVVIPATIGGVDVTAIGEMAFSNGVSRRITSVTFPSTLLSIGGCAFDGCDNMTLPTLPENLKSIGTYALPGGRSNVSYDIPASVISLGYATFGYHTSFSSITLHWTDNIMTYNSDIFADEDISSATLHIPEGMKDAYAEKGWTTTAGFASIVDDVVIPSESTFLTTFPLSKDYFDKYSDTDPKGKTTAVTDTATFTIAPITDGAPAFGNNGAVEINVSEGVGSTDVTLPTYTNAGEYWYSIKENAGTTAGVTYDTTATYYLHVIVDNEDGEFGVRSAQIHLNDSTKYDPENAADKITAISNIYGEGTLTVTQNVTFNGEESDNDTAAFVETVTFTVPEGTVITGNITYGEGDDKVTITPEDWNDGTYSVDITLKNGDSVTFSGLPDGVTYTVSQKTADEAFDLENVEFDVADETGDTVTELVAHGTIGDPADTVTITNAGFTPLDVGVILETGAFVLLALGAIALGVWLIVAKRKNRDSIDEE